MIKQITANKKHMCHVCNKDILPGCEYIQEKGMIAGRHVTYDRHIHCDAVLYALDLVSLSCTTEHIVDNVCATYCDEYDNCDKENLYSCGLVHKILLNPVMFKAARESVKKNGGSK